METHYLPSPAFGRILLLVSPDSTASALFEMAARLALQGPLVILDGGNTFQGYYLARALRRQTADISIPLQRVALSRVFTCYQMEALLADGNFGPRGSASPHPILILDFLSTFYDQGVRAGERRRLLRGCIQRLQAIARSAPVAVWVRQRSAVPQEALSFLEVLQRAAGQVWYPPRSPALPVMQQPALFSS